MLRVCGQTQRASSSSVSPSSVTKCRMPCSSTICPRRLAPCDGANVPIWLVFVVSRASRQQQCDGNGGQALQRMPMGAGLAVLNA